jgi:cobalt/nickel transport system permease protein
LRATRRRRERRVETLFDHRGSNHILGRVDGRLKVLLTGGILALVLSSTGFTFPLTIAAASLLLCGQMRVPVKAVFLRFSEPLLIAVILILMKLFFSGREPLFSVSLFGFTISGYREGLVEGLAMGSRITGAVSVVSVLGFVTPFSDIISALSWLRVPKGLIDILMFAYRYIFMLSDEAVIIYSAQKNRLGYSNLRRGLSSFGILAGSLTLKALEHSQCTALAMVQRGYDGAIPVMKHRRFKTSEVIGSALLVLIAVLLWKI